MIEVALWLVPLAIVVVGVWRPPWAVYIFAATLPLFGSAPGGPHLTIGSAASIALILVAVVRGNRPEVRYRWSGVAALLWLLVAVAALVPWPQWPVADWRGALTILTRLPLLHGYEPLFGWTVIANLCLGLLVAWSVLRLIPRGRLSRLAVAISAGVVATVLIGVLARGGLIDLWTYRPSPREMDDLRFQSLWADSRRLAEYLVLAWPLALVWSRRPSSSERLSRRGRGWLQGLFFALVALGIVWSLQRGAWIAVLIQLAALALFDRTLLRRIWRWLVAVAIAVIAVVALNPAVRAPLAERALDLDDSSRVHYFRVAADLFGQRPILGWGAGSWAFGYDLVAAGHGGRIRGADTAHGLPTQIAAERGIIGILAFGVLLATLALRARPASHPAHLAIALSAIGLLSYGIFQYPPYLPVLEWLLWMLVGMWAACTQESLWEWRLALWVGGVLTAATLAAVPFQEQRPWQEPPRIGSFAWEGGQRGWRRSGFAPNHRWVSDYLAVSLPRDGRWLSFSIVDGHPKAREHVARFTLRVDGKIALEQSVSDRWHRCRVRVPQRGAISTFGFEDGETTDVGDGQEFPFGGLERAPEWALVEIEVDPGFRPFRDQLPDGNQRSRDVRLLGMVLGNTCDAVFCWDDTVARRRARRAGMQGASACFPDQPPRQRKGPVPTW